MPPSQPATRHILAATLAGAIARIGSFVANLGFPHGDVHLDAATAQSLASGLGFWTPWEEGMAFRPDVIGVSTETFGHPADQHGPLWPLLATPLTWLSRGDGVLALQMMSLLSGVLTIPIAYFAFARFCERAGILAMWACALALPLCDYSGNGSLYSAQVLGLLALPVVAGELDTKKRSLAAGALLGLLFLLNYQCAVLIPAFAAAAIVSLGFARAAGALSFAGAACVGVTFPWFLRNYYVFGEPFYTTNIEFVVHHLGRHSIDTSGERPLMENVASFGDFVAGIAGWFPRNCGHWINTIHLALPVLAFFAPGGFARMFAFRRDGRRTVAGPLILFSFVALFLISSAWPAPKARYLVPMIAVVAGAAMVELAAGARWCLSAGAAIVTIIIGAARGITLLFVPRYPWLAFDSPGDAGFPGLEMSFLLPTILIPFVAAWPRVKKHLPIVILSIIGAHGAFRVALSLNKPFCASLFGIEVQGESMFGPPTATFYEILGGPFMEGNEYSELIELKRASMRFQELGVERIIAPVEIYYFWDGTLVSLPSAAKRFDLGVLPRTQEAFRADGVIVPRDFLLNGDLQQALLQWALRAQAPLVFGDQERSQEYLGFQFPKPQ